ncbi:LysR family transcriptional regulator [Rhizobium sp. CG5]|uniref:LysR substrate-binding domain-containing protein n=1 Tax=Rhizobium sp. CG5 TaxID=2726076 RepID=UPI002033A63C|nr:LysR substrate-binding domain-containing protein [Rhizobium sp. CG5]MCM2473076.1 LysR family transcriptional regulator [Rhizobium sp. CG5]
MKLSRQFPLNALRVFEATARQASFTKAGQELGMTQTAVSYQIKLLEESIGEPLFLRQTRRISLTEAGQRLAPKVSEAFDLLQEAVAHARNSTEGTLNIHSTATFASRWLARHIGSFQLKNPAIAVRLETAQEMIDFAQTEADVAIRAGKGDWPGLRCHSLMKVDFSPMVSPELAASIGGLSTPADLLKLRLIDPGDPWWKIWLTAAGVSGADLESRPRSRLGAQSFEAQVALAGQGVAMLTPAFYPEELAMGHLIQPFDLVCNEGSHYWLAYPESRRNAPKIRAFRDWLLGELKPSEPA